MIIADVAAIGTLDPSFLLWWALGIAVANLTAFSFCFWSIARWLDSKKEARQRNGVR